MKPHIHTLANGLRVIFIDIKAFPSTTTLLLVGAGSRYENKDNNGIAHFFEHMAFKGSKKYPSSYLISSLIEGLGGVFNAFTAKDHTGYWIKATDDHFEKVIDVIADMVLHPLLLEEEINKEKGVIIEEINMYEDTPYRKVGELFDNVLYDGYPLGFDIAGTKKTVKAVTRQTFLDYIDRLYRPGNAVLVVAGGLGQVKSKIDLIEKRFSSWKKGDRGEMERVVEKQSRPNILIKHKKTEQTHFCLGFRAFSFFDKRRYVLSILSAILGGGMSSRLFMEVREKRGLCYYISTGREFYHDVGNMATQAGVTNDIDKIKESIELVLKEHKKIKEGDVSRDELEKAKALLKGRLLLSLEDSFNVASFFGTKQLLEDQSIAPESVVEKLETVTRDEVVALAQDIFRSDRLNLAMIGPFEALDVELDI